MILAQKIMICLIEKKNTPDGEFTVAIVNLENSLSLSLDIYRFLCDKFGVLLLSDKAYRGYCSRKPTVFYQSVKLV